MVENKELSFIDLLSVLIKYRKVELIPSILFAIVYGFILFVFPIFCPSKTNTEVEIVCSVKLEQMSSSLSSYLDLDIPTLAEKNLKDLANFSQVERNYNIWTPHTEDERAYNTEVKRVFNTKSFSVSKEAKGLFRITSVLREEEIDSFNRFISDYIQYCSNLLEVQVESLVYNAEKNIEQMIAHYEQKDSMFSDISSLLSLQLEFKNYRENHRSFLIMNGQPFESNISKGRVKKLFKGVSIVFILSLGVTFFLYVISGIKDNPEKRKKIIDAWKAGK